MDNLRGLLGISRMDKVPNAQIRELCGGIEGTPFQATDELIGEEEERIDESVL